VVKKQVLLQAVIEQLHAELAPSLHAARLAASGATDEQNKAENKYDTRGLELSYLAAGQARQIAEAEAAIEQMHRLALRDFGPGEAIDLTAVITLTAAKSEEPLPRYFLAPCGGGTEVRLASQGYIVITPQSPLGQQLLGRRKGETIKFGRDATVRKIADVC
jgi:hypothetical protein